MMAALKPMLFVVGTFLENETPQMLLIFLLTLSTLGGISVLMIRTYQRTTRLTFIEKLPALLGLFMVHEALGILSHAIYYTKVIGENPTTGQMLEKIQQIVWYDSIYLFPLLIIVGFTKSKIV